MRDSNFKDSRLLEAFDEIDPRFIAEVADELKIEKEGEIALKPSPRRSIKYVLALAACALLLGALIPVVTKVISLFPAGTHISETTVDTASESEAPEISKGHDYILTEDDLAMMNAAYRKKIDLPESYNYFETLEAAMLRQEDNAYYFGKYGDTVVIWRGENWYCCFNLGGFNFDFYNGRMMFFENGEMYNYTEASEKEIMTTEEIKEFYDDYINHYLPMALDPYTWLEFVSEIEALTEDEMKRINKEYEAWQYEILYKEGLEIYADSPTPNVYAEDHVFNHMGYDPHRFFHEDNYEKYQYYGKIGDKVILAVQNDVNVLTVIEIEDCKFVLNGRDCTVLVYENGIFTELSEAYEKGVVTRSELTVIHERYMSYVKYFLGGLEDTDPPAELKITDDPNKKSPIMLTDEENRRIVWEYIANSRKLEEDLKYTYGVRCYGKFDGAYAVMIDGPFGYMQAEETVTVAGYVFTFPNSQPLYIYRDGVFYKLYEAYERGVVTRENIAAIEWDKTEK